MRRAGRRYAVQEEMRAVYAEPLPEVTAQIALPLETLKALPEGVEVGRRNDRVRTSVVRQGDSVVVRAVCDSVLRQVMVYGERKVEREEAPPRYGWIVLLVLLVLLGGWGWGRR